MAHARCGHPEPPTRKPSSPVSFLPQSPPAPHPSLSLSSPPLPFQFEYFSMTFEQVVQEMAQPAMMAWAAAPPPASVGPLDPQYWHDFLIGMIKPVAALAVVAMAIALSFTQHLGLEGEMGYAIARAFLQLSLVGFVLEFIFAQKMQFWIILAYLFMVTMAGYTAGQRAKRIPQGKYIAGVSILAGTSVTMFLLVALNVFPFTAQYIIPISGMMVSNAMTVTGVAMKRLREDIKLQTNLVETALALGATPRQATHEQVRRSLILALSPVIDNAKTMGLISLPGAMTGLIMAGASPLEAVRLQIIVMNMLMGATTVSSIVSSYLCWRVFFTKAYQLETRVFAN